MYQIEDMLTLHRPPALALLPGSDKENSSPPPEIGARKIMRRGEFAEGISGPSTTANSEGPSKATSEIGDGSSGKVKDKSSMTREEREKAYAEARLRIMGKAEPDPEDATKTANDNDLSRSSSASGKKKTKKRKDDDDFEPRSQFPGYYGTQSFNNPGYGDGSFYFPQYTAGVMSTPQQQYSMAPTASPPPVVYSSGYMSVDQNGQMQYMSPQQYGSQPNSNMSTQTYSQSNGGQYDINAQFSAMNFGPTNQQSLPQKPSTSSTYPSTPSMGQHQQGWVSSPYDNQQFMYTQQPMYGQYQAYQFGQLPNQALQGGKMQHPLPGSYNRQQFNPQTQAFVPGGAGRGGPMQMPVQGGPFFGQYGMNHNAGMQPFRPSSGPPPNAQQHRPSPATVKSNTGSYPSPAMQQPVQAYNMATPTMHFQTPHVSYSQPQQPTTDQTQRPVLTPGTGTLAHPLPQPPNPESSIAKWGTHASLPRKPPTPTNQYPTKYLDINKGMPKMSVPGLPRYSSGSAGNGA